MPKGPKEWQQGDLTPEEIARISQPIGEAPGPDAPIEVTPEPEPAPADEPPIVIDIDDEPQAAVPPAEQIEVPPTPAPTPENNMHEQMVKAILQLLRGVYRARNSGQEPDEKYLNRMREIYASQTNERLQQAVDALTKEGTALKQAA